MTNNERERVVKRLKEDLLFAYEMAKKHGGTADRSMFSVTDLRSLLSERAELLATVERMRGAVEQIATAEVNEFRVGPAGGANICLDGEEWFCLSRDVRPVLEIARAALTTGEEK